MPALYKVLNRSMHTTFWFEALMPSESAVLADQFIQNFNVLENKLYQIQWQGNLSQKYTKNEGLDFAKNLGFRVLENQNFGV